MFLLAGEGGDGGIVLKTHGNGLRQPAGGVGPTSQNVNDGLSACLTQEPGFQNRLGLGKPVHYGDHRAIGKDHNHLVIDLAHSPEKIELLGRQINISAVEPFGLGVLGQTEEEDHLIGIRRGLDGLVGQRLILGSLIQGEPWNEVHIHARLLEGVQGRGDLGGGDVGGTATLVARGAGEFADQSDLFARSQGKHTILVLEHDDGFLGGLAGHLVMGLHVIPVALLRHGGLGLLDEVQNPLGHPVELILIQVSGPDRLDNLMVAGGWRHLKVETGTKGRGPVMHGAPVRHDQTLITPLTAQHVGQQPAVLRSIHPVELVVGAHDGPGFGVLDYILEGGQVYLAQGALIDVGADPETIGLLVVGSEVLQGGAHGLPDLIGQIRVPG